jgi:uncharacterized membrane protein
MKQLVKYLVLFLIGGYIYYTIEILFRGYSHWTMMILGSVCFILMGVWNEIWSWEVPLWKQMLLGGFTTTLLEFITGCIVNLWLGWNIWNYSSLPLNILGQISLPFTLIWCGLSLVGIILDDYIRYFIFGEERPRYKLY